MMTREEFREAALAAAESVWMMEVLLRLYGREVRGWDDWERLSHFIVWTCNDLQTFRIEGEKLDVRGRG